MCCVLVLHSFRGKKSIHETYVIQVSQFIVPSKFLKHLFPTVMDFPLKIFSIDHRIAIFLLRVKSVAFKKIMGR